MRDVHLFDTISMAYGCELCSTCHVMGIFVDTVRLYSCYMLVYVFILIWLHEFGINETDRIGNRIGKLVLEVCVLFCIDQYRCWGLQQLTLCYVVRTLYSRPDVNTIRYLQVQLFNIINYLLQLILQWAFVVCCGVVRTLASRSDWKLVVEVCVLYYYCYYYYFALPVLDLT